MKFTSASATAGGHTGAINDAAWQASAVALDGGAASVYGNASAPY